MATYPLPSQGDMKSKTHLTRRTPYTFCTTITMGHHLKLRSETERLPHGGLPPEIPPTVETTQLSLLSLSEKRQPTGHVLFARRACELKTGPVSLFGETKYGLGPQGGGQGHEKLKARGGGGVRGARRSRERPG